MFHLICQPSAVHDSFTSRLKMLIICLLIGFLVFQVSAVVRNVSCPEVTPRELNWKEMDGTWYLAAVATDLPLSGDCAMVTFEHQDTLGVSIKWITNNTASFYNGSVALIPDPNTNSTGDLLQVTYNVQKTETYAFLAINYEHFAVVFACYDNEDGNSSTYEIWKMTRSPHLKSTDATKIDQAIANYSLQDTAFVTFNNTEDTCWVSSSSQVDTASLIMTSAVALTLFRRLY